jgi:hypothetical protein
MFFGGPLRGNEVGIRIALFQAAWFLSIGLLSAAPAEIALRRSADYSATKESGRIEIRLRVGSEARVWIRGGRMSVEATAGGPATDAGSSHSGPLPQRDASVRLQARVARGQVQLLQRPSRQNRFTAMILIRDPEPGVGLYDLLLTFGASVAPPSAAQMDGITARYFNTGWRRPAAWDAMPGRPLPPPPKSAPKDYSGQFRGSFSFSGFLNDEALFFIRGTQVTYYTKRRSTPNARVWGMTGSLAGNRTQSRMQARGSNRVRILETPSPANRFTAVVQVGPHSGNTDISFSVTWTD